ncbi:hypothetical protein ACIQVO_17030 [Streptomyces sp. NPDC101062]|uniref:hypothetical protein n=1 Tax=unclassified Streptomyces TaxID=2593676 RepID=UPI0038044CCF
MKRVAWFAVPVCEIVLIVCLLAGVSLPTPLLLAAEAVVLVLVVLEALILRRHYAAARRSGTGRRDALAAAVRTAVPTPVRRLTAQEIRSWGNLVRWAARRTHGVGAADLPVPYTGPQTAMLYGLLSVAVVETVALALLIPWPLVHLIMLVLDVYTVVMVLALHAGCVTRPHVVGADGSLRIRYGTLFDLRIPAADIVSVRADRRFPDGGLLQYAPAQEDGDGDKDGGGVLDLVVGSQTTVRVELSAPVPFVRPLGATGRARVVRFHADRPEELVKAVRAALPPAPGVRG